MTVISLDVPGPQTLSPMHHRIIDLALQGLGNKDIAALVDRTPQNVMWLLQSPLAQNELARRRAKIENRTDNAIVTQTQNAAQILKQAEADAARGLVDLMNSEDEGVRFRAIDNILNRNGVGNKGESIPITMISCEKLAILVQTLKEDAIVHNQNLDSLSKESETAQMSTQNASS